MHTLSVRDCIKAGWSSFKARPWFIVGVSLILFGASVLADIPRSLANHAGDSSWILGFIAFLVSTGLTFLVSMGRISFFLRAHDAPQSATIHDAWRPNPYWKFVAVSVLVGAATIIGFVLLIVPGIIVAIIFGFSSYIVIEKGLSPIDALKASAALTKGNRWNLFLLGLALLGLNLLGLCALVVGLIVTLPVSALALVHAYRVLSGTHAAVVAAEPVAVVADETTEAVEPTL